MAVKTKQAPKGKKKDFDDTNRGVLFVNDKDGNDARPDFTGNLAIDPSEFEAGEDGLVRIRLAAWIKPGTENTNGDFYSIAASPLQQK